MADNGNSKENNKDSKAGSSTPGNTAKETPNEELHIPKNTNDSKDTTGQGISESNSDGKKSTRARDSKDWD